MRVYDRDAIRAFLLRDVELHIYELGDLDPQFFPRTRWYGAGDPLEALCLVYDHPMMQSLLALCREAEVARTTALLAAVGDALPDELYLHHSPGVVLPSHVLEDRGRYDKMRLVDHDAVAAVKSDATPLGLAELPALDRFYERCYPDNWFDPRMIETGAYFGCWQDGEIVSVAGVHVVADVEGVAALGNVATDPACRGRGLARSVTAAACQDLMARVACIGLNVRADNHAAIALYERLGFRRVASYHEAIARRLG
ncbi:MAG: GNAT family N-acetyltransferase [Myxococcales bacterium]|nr:GNAT family N-acetyltransferase [Myxococcales bacterium]